MNSATRSRPIAPATRLRFTESCPRVGSTRLDSTTASGTGRAPELSSVLRSFAVWVVKFPWMTPVPLVKTCWMTGAEISFPSRRICTGLLRKSFESWIHRASSGAPNSKCTTGALLVPWNSTNVGLRFAPVSGGVSE